MLHRLRLHLNANLRHLSNVTWNPDLRQSAVEVAATAVDGVRERFRLRLGRAGRRSGTSTRCSSTSSATAPPRLTVPAAVLVADSAGRLRKCG